MVTSEIPQILNTMENNLDFDFSVDFQGQVEYIESTSTEQFLEFELLLLYLINRELVPVNERTEGSVVIDSGTLYIKYSTCSQVGGDWNEDVWETGSSEHSIVDLMRDTME